jgi:hypothetical protein
MKQYVAIHQDTNAVEVVGSEEAVIDAIKDMFTSKEIREQIKIHELGPEVVIDARLRVKGDHP